jgi:hypothetical protein
MGRARGVERRQLKAKYGGRLEPVLLNLDLRDLDAGIQATVLINYPK